MDEGAVDAQGVPSSDADGLDKQIEDLLRDAEERLRSRSAPTQMSLSDEPRFKLPRLQVGQVPAPYVRSVGDVARVDSSRLVKPEERRSANGLRKVEDPIVVKERMKKAKKASAGPDWFNLPRTDLTPELKRDLQLLRMRSVLDPKRHYKKESTSKKSLVPQYSQVGTVVEGPTEFLSARITNKERKKTLVEEVLANPEARDRYKRKYDEVQAAKLSGGKLYYRHLKAKRAKKKK